MAISIKSDFTIDSMVSQIDFLDEPASAIEIYSNKDVDPVSIRGMFQGLAIGLGMSGIFCEFKVDFEVVGKVRVEGNVSQAMKFIKENNGVKIGNKTYSIFSEKLFSDIDKHEKVQKMLRNCQEYYTKLNNANEGGEPPSPSSINNRFTQFKPVEESKEKDNIFSDSISIKKASKNSSS